jgi:hypothetical protein
MKVKAIVIGAGLAFCGGAALASTEVKVGTGRVETTGCNSSSQTFHTVIPNVGSLDRSYPGVLAGIKVVELSGNGDGHGYKDFVWLDADTLQFTLYATGSGHWVDPPSIFGQKIGGGVCIGAAGGWESVDVYAVYR